MAKSKMYSYKHLGPEIVRLYQTGLNMNGVAEQLGISRNTVMKYLDESGKDRTKKNIKVGLDGNKEGPVVGITNHEIAQVRNQIKDGQLLLCEVDVIDRETTKMVAVLKNMYVVKKKPNGVLVSNNPNDTLGKLVTYVDIVQLRRRLRG